MVKHYILQRWPLGEIQGLGCGRFMKEPGSQHLVLCISLDSHDQVTVGSY